METFVLYQLVEDGTKGYGPEPAGKWVGDQSTDDGGQAGSATEVAEGVGGSNQRQVQLTG